MISTFRNTLAALAVAAAFVPATAMAQDAKNQGYLLDSGSNVVTAAGAAACLRTSDWTPARAAAAAACKQCTPDLCPKPAVAPAPAAKPAAAKPAAAKPAAAKPAAAKPPVIKAVMSFATNGGNLDKLAEFRLDMDVVAKLPALGTLKYMNISGHTDRLGSPQYNQKLSERRANAVKAYLVKKGVDASKIETYGFGKTLPVKSCPDDKDRKALQACLEPNRRVEIEAEGTAK